jgi:hypothetical protein
MMKAFAVVCSLLFGSMALADDFGPISMRNFRALSLPFLRFNPRSGVLTTGEKSLEMGWTVSNDVKVFGNYLTPTVLEDQETSRFSFTYRQGLPRNAEWWVEAPVLVRGGGFMDPIIDWWHKSLLHSTGQDRTHYPFGKCVIKEPQGRFGSGWGLGDVTVGYAKRIDDNFTASTAVKISTGNDGMLLGSGNFDAGAAVDARWPIARKLTVFGQLGWVYQGNSTAMKGCRESIDQEAITLMYQHSSRDAWVIQWQNEPSAFRTKIDPLDCTHRIISMGYQRKIDSKNMLELYFSEDGDIIANEAPELVHIGPDWTMGLRWTTRWH